MGAEALASHGPTATLPSLGTTAPIRGLAGRVRPRLGNATLSTGEGSRPRTRSRPASVFDRRQCHYHDRPSMHHSHNP